VKFPSNRFEMAAKFLSKIKGGKYLEIGAGDGSLALTLINNFSHLALIEISEKRIEMLSKLFDGKNVEILTTILDHENLPYSDNTLDVVVMVDVIEHLIDPIRVCNEIQRVLKKGGILIIGTPNIAKITRRIKLAAGYFPSTASLWVKVC
jgi:ubiquinone/menaquinone biosynthesis C-methylase UbiE